MNRENFFRELAVKNEKKIILLIMDGVGGIPYNGKTALEAAEAKNLNELAKKSSCGRTIPVSVGITPGSGPAHFSLFGYDPVKYNVGRGILEALGIDVDVAKHDVVARGNFCTIDGNGIVTDRRAGRIPTEKNREIIKLLSDNIKEIDGVKITLFSGKEHRFVLKMSHPNLSDKITDADPQHEGLPLKYPEPKTNGEKEKFTIKIVKKVMDRAIEILKNSHPANGMLLRGFAEYPRIPSMQEIFKLNPAAIANYPMYRGLAKLVGMNVLTVGAEIDDEIETLKREWDNFDYFFVHIKKTDSYGEDGNFENKVKIIKKVDKLLPQILSLKPDAIAITGDHSTPCKIEGHSWHPNPFMLYSDYIIPDDVEKFTEKECARGILGTFNSMDILPLLLANTFKFKKFGA